MGIINKNVLNKNVMSAFMQVSIGCQQNGILQFLLNLDKQFLSVESDDRGKTPLHFAAIYNNFKAVNTLLNRCADINVQDQSKISDKFNQCFCINSATSGVLGLVTINCQLSGWDGSSH